jgi:hypothetical protein
MREREAPTIEDVLAVVRAIASPGLRAEALEAEVWRVVRQARQARLHRAATGRAHPDFGDGSLSGATGVWPRKAGHGERLSSAALLRAGAAVCRVLSGDSPEPQAAGSELRSSGANDSGGALSNAATLRS